MSSDCFGMKRELEAIGNDVKPEFTCKNLNTESPHGFFEISLVTDEKMVEIMLHQGADLNKENRYGYTAFCHAVMNNATSAEIVKLMLERGAAVNTCIHGDPLILKAIEMGSVEKVRVLLEHGADISHKLAMRLKDKAWIDKDVKALLHKYMLTKTEEPVVKERVSVQCNLCTAKQALCKECIIALLQNLRNAIDTENTKNIEAMINKYPWLLDITDPENRSLIYYAVQKSKVDSYNILLALRTKYAEEKKKTEL